MRALAIAVLSLSLIPAAAYARAKVEEVKSPITVNLETKASAAQVKKAVKLAVLNRKWTISNEKGNSFDASYTRESKRASLSATINITHSPRSVTIKYVSSDGMNHDAGRGTIDRTYNGWVGNLEKDIPIYVEREVIASE